MDYYLYNDDCLNVLPTIADKSIDFICVDLPYGTIACKWDVQIPLAPLWEHYERIMKDDGAIALLGTQPFTTTLISSRMELYRYSWVWIKEKDS